MSDVLSLGLPLFFSGVVVENTTRCNARCAMCYQAAGPKGSDTWGKQALSVSEVCLIAEQAIEIETVYPRFHLSGGEAFLRIADCIEIVRRAREVGFLDVTTTTNAYWAANRIKARETLCQLRDAGLTSMEVSWDVWHMPYVDPIAVSNCLEEAAKVDIETNLRILSTKSHSFDEALSVLSPKALEAAERITCGPVFATGRAKSELPADDFHEGDGPLGNFMGPVRYTLRDIALS